MAGLTNPAVSSLLLRAHGTAQRAHDDALEAAHARTTAEMHVGQLTGRLSSARTWAANAEAAVASGLPGAVEQAEAARQAWIALERELTAAEREYAAAGDRHRQAAAAHLAAHNAAVAAQRSAYAGYRDPAEEAV